MNRDQNKYMVKTAAACLAWAVTLTAAACGKQDGSSNLLTEKDEAAREVRMFSPMEKTEADTVNTARSAADKTIVMAEEQLGIKVNYVTYTEIGRAHV